MRLPRARFTLRSMMVLVAVVALGLAVVEEFQYGLPPRFVLRGIPGRIARLRPGMTPAEAYETRGGHGCWAVLAQAAGAPRGRVTRVTSPKSNASRTSLRAWTHISCFLIKGPVRLLLDPNGYDIPGADGIMDIYLLPPYDPVATLYLEEGQWFIHSPFPAALDAVDDPTKWTRSRLTKDSITNTLGSIVEHAVPSV